MGSAAWTMARHPPQRCTPHGCSRVGTATGTEPWRLPHRYRQPILRDIMSLFSRVLYIVISVTLLCASVTLIGVAVWRAAASFLAGEAALETMLDGIGLIIIAVAVADVGKFLYEEEVVSDRELRRPSEARGSLTKFMTIMIVALSLESLVLIAKTSRETMGNIVYPGLLMSIAVLALVGLGLFQRLSQSTTASVSPELDEKDEEGERKEPPRREERR
jgi:tellurite resistance protein TehA-like permease